MNKIKNRGFSMIETLVTLAVLGIIASISYTVLGGVKESADEQKLKSDVATLNRSVKIYLASGGTLGDANNPEQVLGKLRTMSDKSYSHRIPGLSSSMVDPRAGIIMQTGDEARSGELRALWDPKAERFVVANDGARGIKRFIFDDKQGDVSVASENRNAAMMYASSDGWVWDYQDRATGKRSAPTVVATTLVPNGLPSGGPIPNSVNPPPGTLRVPQYSIPGGTYEYPDFDLNVELINPNPDGVSELYYGIDGGPLNLYRGVITIAPGMTIEAQAISTHEAFLDSGVASELYNAEAITLLPPTITTDQERFGLFSDSALMVTLAEPNTPGTANIRYRLNSGAWADYNRPFILEAENFHGGLIIEAQSVPVNPGYYQASTVVSKDVGHEGLTLSGVADGGFRNPTGENRMVTNLANDETSSEFYWGEAAGKDHHSSAMRFDGGAFANVGSGERFKVGELTYYNGTIKNGTGATAVDLALDMDLRIAGNPFRPQFIFQYELLNTSNANQNKDPWSAADFVRISEPRSSQSLIINGFEFQFRLEFGETTADGFADFDEFHVLENKDSRVSVYGTFINLGPVATP